jgi:hypothetical protein
MSKNTFAVESAVKNAIGAHGMDWQGLRIIAKDLGGGYFKVLLEGQVRDIHMKAQAEEAAKGVEGVTEVVSKLLEVRDGG